MRRLILIIAGGMLLGSSLSCAPAPAATESPAGLVSGSPDAPRTLARQQTCQAICDRHDRCAQRDLSESPQLAEACTSGCDSLAGAPTSLEARVLECASLEECEGFHACTMAIFQPGERANSCAAVCQSIADCRGEPSTSCLADCEAYNAAPQRATAMRAPPCAGATTCDAMERCLLSWNQPEDPRVMRAATPAAPSTSASCRQLCVRTVECAGEAAQLGVTETARVVEMMDQGLVSCVLDCEANTTSQRTAAVQSCAEVSSCEEFETCAAQL